jgi:hypothetical protein
MVDTALPLAILRLRGKAVDEEDRAIEADLEHVSVSDDGSSQWQYVIDLIAMLSDAVHGTPVALSLKNAINWYLEGTFNVLSNETSHDLGRPISLTEARERLELDDRWIGAKDFVKCL